MLKAAHCFCKNISLWNKLCTTYPSCLSYCTVIILLCCLKFIRESCVLRSITLELLFTGKRVCFNCAALEAGRLVQHFLSWAQVRLHQQIVFMPRRWHGFFCLCSGALQAVVSVDPCLSNMATESYGSSPTRPLGESCGTIITIYAATISNYYFPLVASKLQSFLLQCKATKQHSNKNYIAGNWQTN